MRAPADMALRLALDPSSSIQYANLPFVVTVAPFVAMDGTNAAEKKFVLAALLFV